MIHCLIRVVVELTGAWARNIEHSHLGKSIVDLIMVQRPFLFTFFFKNEAKRYICTVLVQICHFKSNF